MKATTAAAPLLCLLLLAAPLAQGSPIAKVIDMLSDLEAKIIDEGNAAQKVYEEFAEWCEDRSKDLMFEIKTGKTAVAELEATIEKEAADIAALDGKIEDLTAELAKDEQDLKAATEIRAKEAAVFQAEEADLSETIDVLQRAITIIERGSSFLQAKGMASFSEVLKVLVQGSAMDAADSQRLTSLVQSSSGSDASEMGAPDPEAYKSHSGDIIATLQGLLDKAESQLAEARSTETANLHNFEVMELTLKDEIRFGNKEIGEAKAAHAKCSEAKAAAEGDLDVTSKALAASTQALADLHAECMEKAEEFEAETKSRGQELKALAEAKRVIKEASMGAEEIAYGLNQRGAVSLLQVARASGAPRFQALRFVRDLAKKHKSPALAQLASRMEFAIAHSSGDDVFAKVKGLIKDLIERLLDQAAADASHKAYCDKELAESNEKKEDLSDELAKLTADIDSKTARSTQLKDEVAKLQEDLQKLAATQAEMDKIRGEEHELYLSQKKEMEEGLEGVKLGLKILKEYYASEKEHEAAEGAASGIIGLLEVVESDFSKSLAEIISNEETAAAEYDRTTKENEILKATMEQDVKYKSKESLDLDNAIAELSSDREGVTAELNAVLETLKHLEDQCIAKPETYEERVARREAEIAGLKEALEILSGEVALMQKGSTTRLRHLRHAA